jgi:lysophospholipase L1-like esterase
MTTTTRSNGSNDMTRRYLAGRVVGIALATALVAAACDDEELLQPTADAGAMFARYVAIGNSITAGFQSGGINDSLQQRSYAKFVADALGTEFVIPLLNSPGCPAPYTNILDGTRLSDIPCALRTPPTPTHINNLGIPGAAVVDALIYDTDSTPPSESDIYKSVLLGGRTPLEVAAEVQPTFVSVWIGNNDVLGAALSGDASAITSTAAFDARYTRLTNDLVNLGVQAAVLIGVVNVTNIPHLSPGAAYFQAAQSPAWPPTFTVANSCAPAAFGGVGESTLVPFGYGFGVLFAQAAAGTPVTLDCATDPPVLSAIEIGTIAAAVADYNQTISSIASQNGWAYFDPNPTLADLKLQGQIPLFPDLTNPSALFGPWLSLDGVHPSTAAHELVADSVMAVLGRTYTLQ